MNSLRLTISVLSLGVTNFSFSLNEIRLVKNQPKIIETIAAYPPNPGSNRSVLPAVVLPFQRTFAQFGGLTKDHPFVLENLNKNSTNELKSKLKQKNNFPASICGGSPERNTINCFDLNKNGQFLASYPIPGFISATPIFHDESWLIATSKGFILRVEANKENNYLPRLGEDNIALWGAYSRKYMAQYKPKPVYSDQLKSSTTESDNALQAPPPNTNWIYSTSSEIVGTPIVQNDLAYVFSANQYLQAIDWHTGKLAWSLRLSPDTNLGLLNNSLTYTNSELIVGTNLGTLLFINPKNGNILWTWQIPEATALQREQTQLPTGPDRFASIIAKPFLFEDNIVASNTDSMTQKISLISKTALWSYPIGSVAQPKKLNDNIFIGSSAGKVLALNFQSGELLWSSDLTLGSSPIMSLFITKSEVLLAATAKGQIFMLDPSNGKILAQNLPIGEINGEFFAAYENSDACLSFSQNGFRCFYAIK